MTAEIIFVSAITIGAVTAYIGIYFRIREFVKQVRVDMNEFLAEYTEACQERLIQRIVKSNPELRGKYED